MVKIVKNSKFYDEDGAEIPKENHICKCEHSALKHVQIGFHPMDGYACTVKLCTCKSFRFDHFK